MWLQELHSKEPFPPPRQLDPDTNCGREQAGCGETPRERTTCALSTVQHQPSTSMRYAAKYTGHSQNPSCAWRQSIFSITGPLSFFFLKPLLVFLACLELRFLPYRGVFTD